MTHFINYNGAILPAGTPVLDADNRSFRYGDGIFETIRVLAGQVLLLQYHLDRLAHGIRQLGLQTTPRLGPAALAAAILDLCRRNDHQEHARVRLVVFRKAFLTPDDATDQPEFLIQSWSLPSRTGKLTPLDKGAVIDIYPDGAKSADALAGLKSNNYLLYSLASLYARSSGLDDCLVLNSRGGIADSSIANIFCYRDRQLLTPPLSEGGVAGVMRRHLLAGLPALSIPVREQPLSPDELLQADEVFLTNAIQGIRPVRSFRNKAYTGDLTAHIYEQLLAKDQY